MARIAPSVPTAEAITAGTDGQRMEDKLIQLRWDDEELKTGGMMQFKEKLKERQEEVNS